VKRKQKRWSHVVGFDDGPFPGDFRGDVLVVGAVFAGERLDGVLSRRVRRDGANATMQLAATVKPSRFHHFMGCAQGSSGFAGDSEPRPRELAESLLPRKEPPCFASMHVTEYCLNRCARHI